MVAVESPTALGVVDEPAMDRRVATGSFDGTAIVDPHRLGATTLHTGDEPSHAQQGWAPKSLRHGCHASIRVTRPTRGGRVCSPRARIAPDSTQCRPR